MLKFLIISYPHDAHPESVAWALRRNGHEVVLLSFNDFCAYLSASISIDNTACSLHFKHQGKLHAGLDQFDVVWLHRIGRAQLPDDLHAADRELADREWISFITAIPHFISAKAFFANPILGNQQSKSKALQLQYARQIGLNIPRTLISNDPQAVQNFFDAENGAVIFKPFNFSTWIGEGKHYSTYTSPVRAEHLSAEKSIAACPGIYQQHIRKKYEVRATIMGHECIAARLMSQEHASTSTDWRAGAAGQTIATDPFVLPAQIRGQCIALMERLGIVFGCFDFMVTEDDEFVFLEVNEMGQFLWMEEDDPQFPLLDTFVKFLESRNPQFQRGDAGVRHRYADFRDSPEYVLHAQGDKNPSGHNVRRAQGVVTE
ncbi:hypothetical protein [Janthinobacterium fluminis]|uniref:ATP-grasp domain-containing protein n=1 Tax=Janthinobacterium fluminis TaxID=2987524 RepID=A0ABT5JZL4_9BURK|nr:hypothetical protein [Janthinobacterium fluminis]MDC8758167.1 hypothetical protein [Janthinobacterium fluminis]